MKILIAEDDLVTRELLKRVLTHLADEIVEASEGREALEKLKSEDPDFLFTDLEMPVLDGQALVETIRGSNEHKLLPIVCLSAVNEKEKITSIAALGVQDYVLKPIRPAEVHDRFRRVIEQHSGWRRKQAADDRGNLLLIDPDVHFCEFAKPFLETTFGYLESSSAPDALRLYKDADVKPKIIVVARGLSLIDELQLAALIRKLALDQHHEAPEFWLLSDEEQCPDTNPDGFSGIVRRTFVAEAFKQELKRTLLRGRSPANQIASYLRQQGRGWLVSATRQTVGMTLAEDVKTLDKPATTQPGVAAQVELTGPGVRVSLIIASPKNDALALTRTMLNKPPEFNDLAAAADALGELANDLAVKARSALIDRGYDLQLGTPKAASDFDADEKEKWDPHAWFAMESGNTIFVGLRADEGESPPGAVPESKSDATVDPNS